MGVVDDFEERSLTRRERAVLRAMLRHAAPSDGEAILPHDRGRWVAVIDGLCVVGMCACGTCPSVEFVRESGTVGTRVILEAAVTGAMLMVFIDSDAPSYLELAPLADDVFTEFPPPAAITFAAA